MHSANVSEATRHSMPVGPATIKKSKEVCERAQTLNVFGVVAWVFDLYTIEPQRYERLQPVTTTIWAWMSPDRDRASRVRNRNCFANLESLLLDECRFPGAEIPVECLAGIPDFSALDQSAGNVRTPHRTTGSFGHHVLHFDRNSNVVEPVDNKLCADFPRFSKQREPKLERSGIGYVQCKNVNLASAVISAQLHARNDSNPCGSRSASRFRNPVQCVVVRQRDCSYARGLCRCDNFRGREGSVGRCRVHVKIDLA